jgi:hypothetical protein
MLNISVKSKIRGAARRAGIVPLLKFIRFRLGGEGVPLPGKVRFGDFRRLEPISRQYGYDRGRPIDRYYIENFLQSQGRLITGHVLEIGERTYTELFGQGVIQSDMLHVNDEEGATYVDDLTDGYSIPSNIYDCVILTQTLHLIFDMKQALTTIFRILKPGGVLLCTVPGITQVADPSWNDTWYWSLTKSSAKKLCEQIFQAGNVEVVHHGNVLAAISFLQGLADSELTKAELDHVDPEYPVTIAITARAGDANAKMRMTDLWNYEGQEPTAYDEETSYQLGMAHLDGQGTIIEDWGCGSTFAKKFVSQSRYVGIDGSTSPHADVKTELQEYRSEADCIFMRHVLEHNWGWRQILENAISSFRKRMTLIIFTPFANSDEAIAFNGAVPDLSLSRSELTAFFAGLNVREETIVSATQYGTETIFYLEK